jgi:hypothetical protein
LIVAVIAWVTLYIPRAAAAEQPVEVLFGSAEATADTPTGRSKVGMGRYVLIGPEADARAYAERVLKRSLNSVIIGPDDKTARKLFDHGIPDTQERVHLPGPPGPKKDPSQLLITSSRVRR